MGARSPSCWLFFFEISDIPRLTFKINSSAPESEVTKQAWTAFVELFLRYVLFPIFNKVSENMAALPSASKTTRTIVEF